MQRHEIIPYYQEKASAQLALIDSMKKRLNQIALSRLGSFIAETLLIAMIITWGFHWIYIPLMIVPIIAFMVLVRRQSKVEEALHEANRLHWIFENELATLRSRANAYDNGSSYMDDSHGYASDLDIFGELSLFSYINRCQTIEGMDLLASSLGHAAERTEIEHRQSGVNELLGYIEESYHFRARLKEHDHSKLATIKRQLSGELGQHLKFAASKGLRTYVQLAPLLMLAMLAWACLSGGLLWNFFGLLILVNLTISYLKSSEINNVYAGFSGSAVLLKSYAACIAWTEGIQWKSQYITSFFRDSQGTSVSSELKQLSAIITAFDARLNMIVGFFLNAFMLWDIRCTIRLANWYAQSSSHIINGLERLSKFEELISLSTLTFNQPDWIFPVIQDDFAFEAAAVGHPLISELTRVNNNYVFSDRASVDIITGSNMAGKSTFLRTVGVNMVLAFAGAPVCASQFRTSVFSIRSYMRIKDSLNDQTSTFKAELNRLKMILESTRSTPNALVLIDEMLRGTNSKDKFKGSEAFIKRMVEQNTMTLFATHDLALSELQLAYPEQVRNFHFDIHITEADMEFDYLIKSGACRHFNAAILLKQIGLSED